MFDILQQARELIRHEGHMLPNTGIWQQDELDGCIVYDGGDWIADACSEYEAKFIAYSHNHAPDIARVLLEAVEVIKETAEMSYSAERAYDFLQRLGVSE